MSESIAKFSNLTKDNRKGENFEGSLLSPAVLFNIQEKPFKPDVQPPAYLEIYERQLSYQKRFLNYQNIEECLNYLKSFQSEVPSENQNTTLQINMTIDENFEAPNLNVLSNIHQNKSIVLLFMDKNGKQFLLYWKIAGMDYFLSLKEFNFIPDLDYKELFVFIADFLVHSITTYNHIGIHIEHNSKKNKIDIKDIADHQNCNLFQNAAEEGEVEVVKIIIQHGKMEFAKDMPNSPLSPQALALKNEHFNVFAMIIKANYSYPQCMDTSNFPDDIKNWIKAGTNMHLAIKSGDVTQVEEILSKNPTQKHFFNLKNESALKVALVSNSYDIYKLLLNKGIEFTPYEERFDFLTIRQRKKLTEFHFRHSKDLRDNHINILMINTTVSHYDNNNDDKEKFIKKAYEVLNQDPSTKVILEAVAASKKFEIVFDFKRDSVHMVDLTVDKNTKGIFHSSGKICVGAKQLLDPLTEHETFGTLAHELCHYALHLTYKNISKPYKEDDSKRMNRFEDISKTCKEKKANESLIGMVYDNYQPDEYHAELAVRAPHLIAQNYNQPGKLMKTKAEYSEMFNYYENFVVPDMKAALPKIRKEAEEMSSDKIILICFIVSLCLIGLMGWVYYIMFYTPYYKYDQLTPFEQRTVRNASVKYMNVDLNLCSLYPNNTEIYKDLTSEHITRIFKNERLDLSKQHFSFLTTAIFFSWTNLTQSLKYKFLSSTAFFQDENIKLKELNDLYPNAFDSLKSNQIISVLDGKIPLSIGQMKELSTRFYMDRKFIPENSIYAQLKYGNSTMKFKKFYESDSNGQWSLEFSKYKKRLANVVSNSVDRIKENKAIQKLTTYTEFHKNLTDVISNAEHSKIFVLSSDAGAGKTVTFEHLAIELKKKYPTRWVSYIDLKEHKSLYDENELLGGIEGFLAKVLKQEVDNEFERKLFVDSFKSSNAILLWNGFDEISPLYSNFTKQLLKNIHNNTNNTQFICTRPLYSDELNDYLKIDSYMLVPFNENEQKEFIKKYLSSKNVTDPAKVNLAIENFNNITYELIHNSDRKFDNPLVLSMFADLPENQINARNLYEIFHQFVRKKSKVLEDKNITDEKNILKNAPNSHFNTYRIYQRFSLKIDIFPFAFFTNPLVLRLGIFKLKFNPLYFSQVSQAGILIINDETKFDFAHKTFAEFFIAQYIIDNLYCADSVGLSDEEIDSRLEMFFSIIHYSLSFDNVISFIRDYVRYNDAIELFGENIVKILKNKYKNHLLYILNKPYKDSFRFFFEFFKKDKALMLEMLKVNEFETFYTALFNPFYMSKNLNPEDIKNTVRPYLTDDEFQKFINGKHQKGVMFYGMFDRKEFDKLEVQNLTISNETSFWEFFDMIKSNLSQEEKRQMFLNPIVTFIYRKHSSTNETNQKFWSEIAELFEEHEMTNFLGNMFPQLFRPKLDQIKSAVDSQSLDMLINKTQQILSSDQILIMASKTNLLFRSARSFPQLQIIWDFLVHNRSNEDRKKLLKYDFRESSSNKDQQFYSMYYKFFVMTPRVLHVNVFADNFTDSIDFVEKIYNETFENSEIRELFNESNNFLFPLIFTRPIEACQKVASYLERLYEKGYEDDLLKLIEMKFNDTGLTIFEYFDKILAFAFAERENVGKRLKIFSDLRDKLKNNNRFRVNKLNN